MKTINRYNVVSNSAQVLLTAAMALNEGSAVAAASVIHDLSLLTTNQILDEAQFRVQEASHLVTPKGCKWGHAAFDPVKVEGETLSSEALSIYLSMENA